MHTNARNAWSLRGVQIMSRCRFLETADKSNGFRCESKVSPSQVHSVRVGPVRQGGKWFVDRRNVLLLSFGKCCSG